MHQCSVISFPQGQEIRRCGSRAPAYIPERLHLAPETRHAALLVHLDKWRAKLPPGCAIDVEFQRPPSPGWETTADIFLRRPAAKRRKTRWLGLTTCAGWLEIWDHDAGSLIESVDESDLAATFAVIDAELAKFFRAANQDTATNNVHNSAALAAVN